MKYSLEYLIGKYNRAGNCSDSKTQEVYVQRLFENAEWFDEQLKVYQFYIKANINGQYVSRIQEKLLVNAQTFNELKEVYLWANQRKDERFANAVKEKVYMTAGFFELKDFYYWAEVQGVKLDKKEFRRARWSRLPLIGKLF